ncbi:MAG: hypothetical protein KatS3mg011_0912 [Acidimicrobiia bacterium]|nr:MAG: hypothetical protein KatS3mg011_0912 [Acidimicrobiia bacterium]
MSTTPDLSLVGLVEAAAAVAGQPDLRAVLSTTVEMARRTTGARYAALGVIGEHGGLSDFVYVGIDPEQAARIGSLPAGKGVLGTLIRDPRPIRLDRVSDHPDSVGFPPHHPVMETFLGVPVRVGNSVYGNLYLCDKEGGFTEEDETQVLALAAIAGAAISNAKLNERLRRLALVEDRERIARDIHDGVIQDLFALGLGLQALAATLDEPEAVAKLDQAVDRLDEVIATLRNLIFDLRSLDSTRAEPRGAFRRMAERLAAGRDVDLQLSIGELGELPPDVLDDALLIAREALSNALRHGRPDTVTLQVDRRDSILTLRIEDDGAGFDPSTAPRGMGLANMEERAARTGGELRVESSPGAGTRLLALLRI